jgi:hypothetical protein
MSLRAFVFVALCACSSGSMKTMRGEPQTAREKMLAEQKTDPDGAGDTTGATGKKWGRWRYQGERKDCFFVAGAKCYKTENEACQAARCKAPLACTRDGAGPTTIKCAKPAAG